MKIYQTQILALEDLKGKTVSQVADHISREFEVSPSAVEKYSILVAYESVGSWGCDSNNFFLLQEKETGALFEVHGSHCSCYGFEGQWKPEPTSLEYLQSEKFNFWAGGYDDNAPLNTEHVTDFLSNL